MAIDSPPQLNEWTFRRVVWATLVLASVVIAFWLLYRFYQVVFILFVAIVIGTVIRPAVTWLNRRGISRVAGVILVYLLALALLVGFVLLLFPPILKQGITIAAEVPGYYQSLREWMVNSSNQYLVNFSERIPATLPSLQTVQQTGAQTLASAGQALGFVSLAARIILLATTILLLAFHWTLDGPRIIQSAMLLIPISQRESIREMVTAMETKVGFYIAGQGFLCLVIGIMALGAYLFIGLPNALVLALVAGVMEAIPMVGPLLGAIPASIIALSISPSKLIWVIFATLIIQQIENSLLVPRVMKKAVGVNPFVSLLAIFSLSSFFGIAGALMAIPIAAIVQLLLDRFVFNPKTIEAEVSPGRDYASRLRYEAQDLAQDLRKQARLNKGGSALKVKQIDKMMDEIEAITTDLDSLLAQANTPGVP
jgi:predicted PurR-regulated permease PerM